MRILALLSGLMAVSPAIAGTNPAGPELWQEQLYRALVRQEVVSPDTKLITASYVCTLRVGKADWRVINVVEHVPGAQVPRGHNQIVLMRRDLSVVRRFDYADQYPMACHGASLYLHGDYGFDNSPPYGNMVTFDTSGDVTVSATEAKDLPIPLTSERRTYRLPR
jgi:hypothetical protein